MSGNIGIDGTAGSPKPGQPSSPIFRNFKDMPRHCRHLILLYPLLLISFLSRSQQRRQDTLTLHFAFDSYQLSSPDSTQLQETINRTRAPKSPSPTRPDSISITGYTDKTGTFAYNQRLSWQRANSVYQFLRLETSVPHGQVTGGGVAPTPERSDSDNRRVEIVYYYTLPDAANANAPPHHDTITAQRRSDGGASHTNDSIVVVKSAPGSAPSDSTADSARPAAVLALHRINFIVDTPVPTDSTRSILPQFVTELGQFKDRRLEIDGFVNSVVPLRGTKDPLFILSVRRAKFIYDYLVNAGFDPARLSYKGMGNASPINPTPTTREEMDANMRVEIKVY
jgi:outer membrane protein OmpA-like peptidoglycan-associated protein